MNFKNLEDKCLYYRGLSDYRLMPNSNVLVMLDGRSFSKLVKKKFERPFDDTFIDMMNKTAQYVCENVQGCKFAYVQSDEISLLITDYDTPESDSFFGFRLCKLQSIIASLATSKFNQLAIAKVASDKNYLCKPDIEKLPLYQFDCKAWAVPTSNDAFAWFLYRQIDCIKNSKQQAAQAYIPHNVLLAKNTDEQIAVLKRLENIDWNTDFDDGKKYGRFIYQSIVHMEKDINGQHIDFDRNSWGSHFAFPLTEEGNKEKFLELVPVLNNEKN